MEHHEVRYVKIYVYNVLYSSYMFQHSNISINHTAITGHSRQTYVVVSTGQTIAGFIKIMHINVL